MVIFVMTGTVLTYVLNPLITVSQQILLQKISLWSNVHSLPTVAKNFKGNIIIGCADDTAVIYTSNN